MSEFVLLHGAGGSGWDWHLVEAALRARGHRTIAPDLPAGESATLGDYADAAERALETIRDADGELVVVAHSFAGFIAPLVAARRPVGGIVLVAGMVPAPGEPPADWWANTGYAAAARDRSAVDGGLTGAEDPMTTYYHDVDTPLAVEALARERGHPSAVACAEPWPLDRWPDVPTRFALCREDRLFPAAFLSRVVRDRLGVVPEELGTGHVPALARPGELSDLLERPWHPCREDD